MNKVASAFRPYQIGMRVEVAIQALVRVSTVLGITLSGIIGIEQVLSALPVLDTHLAEQAIELLRGHVQFLGQLGRGEARNGIQHMVGIIRPRLELGYLLIASLQRGLHDLEGTCHDYLITLVGADHHVASLLSYGW